MDPAVLKVAFVRTVGEADRFYVTRSDGNDLIHLVVESAFGLSRGFWGRVDEGVDPKIVNDQANRKGGAGKYAAYGSDRAELDLAEALATADWSSDTIEVGLAEAGARMRAAAPPPVNAEQVREVHSVLGALGAAGEPCACSPGARSTSPSTVRPLGAVSRPSSPPSPTPRAAPCARLRHPAMSSRRRRLVPARRNRRRQEASFPGQWTHGQTRLSPYRLWRLPGPDPRECQGPVRGAHPYEPPDLAKDGAFWATIRAKYRLKRDYINLENGYYCIQPQEVLDAFVDPGARGEPPGGRTTCAHGRWTRS